MTPERKEYALKRISRLTEKLDKINSLIALRVHSGHPADIRNRELLRKDRNSTLTSIKRWEKEIANDETRSQG